MASRIARATAPWQRAIGYLKRRNIDASEGLWFDRCALVHTLGLRASIDVLFVDSERKIVRVVSRARRNRIFYGGSQAVATIELRAGAAQSRNLVLGDRLQLE